MLIHPICFPGLPIIIENGLEFFEVATFDKVENTSVDILFQISKLEPKYTNQINIVGNSRTFDYVIRRELEIVEGDAFYDTQLESIRDKLVSLNFAIFQSVIFNKRSILLFSQNSSIIF